MTEDPRAALIDLLRHGEVGDGVPRFRGLTDDPLTERGWQQIRAVLGSDPPWSEVVTSPRRRCAAVAEHLAKQHGLKTRTLSALAELDFGDWEGRSIEEVQAQDGERLMRFWNDPESNPAPGGESLAAFSRRVLGVWRELGERYSGRHVLLIAHGGTIRIILAHVLGIPMGRLLALEVPYAGFSRVRVGADYAQMVFHNRRSAL